MTDYFGGARLHAPISNVIVYNQLVLSRLRRGRGEAELGG